VKAILKALIVWITLLALPLEGFAAATMCVCAPSAVAHQVAHHDHDHASMADETHAQPSAHTGHHPASHHCAKCATCGACGTCMAMAPACLSVLPASASAAATAASDQHVLPSVDLALPERPPRA
jgi:ABC-type nickel/cobalt efflux system permease component RcnA